MTADKQPPGRSPGSAQASPSASPTSQRGRDVRFYSVPEAARLIGTAPVTLYRAIREHEFPAVRIRGRLIIPAQALDAMIDAAIADRDVVDAAAWVLPEPRTSREA